MSSAALGDTSLPASEPSSTACRPPKQPRHVAFFLGEEEMCDNEKAHATRNADRRGMHTSITADEHRAWSTRAAESDALRQRALQCGEDIARVASGLGYEVVTHPPTAFLKRNLAGVSTSAAVSKPEVEPQRLTAADGIPTYVVDSAASPSPPSAAMPSVLPPAFAKEDTLDSCSSRSSSLGTEEQVGLVPVLSPLLPAEEAGQSLPLDEVTLPRALSSREDTSHYTFTEPLTHSLREEEPSWRDDDNEGSSPFGLLRENFPPSRPYSTTNRLLQSSTNSLGEQSAPSTTQSSPNSSPLPRQSVLSRRAALARHHGVPGNLLGINLSTFQVRAMMADAASSRATSNANTSVSMENLNGTELPVVGVSQNTNGLLTPAVDALNIPAVRATDDEIWPLLYTRSIQ
ncbi:hypothetical protein ABL78_1089 [Leptomonas seymouri]|uniref:Uncharacterized protein n=1 Tax=Leptomonas seymouri TaxID=5684 RepID=A0A0N0P8D7_LEPSE|nr:hypothetical protein ABL78_1089 [Leptomonas seymouri]|eukprot:KPI89826.1 hypothetical protein ABL78_1089 [Leptomonas seymouri]